MKHPFSFFSRLVLLLGMLLNAPAAFAQSNLAIYSDALGSGWQSWSWNSTLNFSTTAPVHGGADSLSVSYTAGYAGLYLSFPAAINTAGYGSLTFWINGGTSGGQNLQVKAAVAQTLNNGVALNSYIAGGSIAANAWRQVTIPLTALGVANISNLTGIVLQDNTGSVQPTYYVDDMMLTAVAPPATVHITVTPSAVLQTLSSRTFGANTAVWDGQLNTPGTISLLNAQGGGTLRYPGGSTSDDFHWKTNTSNAGGGAGGSNFDAFSNVAVQTHANVYITVNYGSGTSQEAADWVTYANKTKNLGFKYWEIGNECYGNWEQDVNSRPHDPTTYATRAADYITKMKTVDPTIKIGVVVVTGEDSSANYSGATDPYAINPRTGVKHYGWTPIVLSKMKTLGVLPDFLIYHRYDQAPGAENDAALLQSAASWPNDIGDIRQQMNDYLGTSAAQTEIVCTEDNSVYTAPGKQTTSLVNGLFMADSLCNAYKTELKTIIWWDLRNSQETGNNNAASLYGWRQYGDYGMMSAANDCYPTYYAGKIVAQFAHGGDQIVSATSDYSYLSAYAAKRADGSVAVLVINKSPVNTLQGSLALPAQVVRPPVSIVSYGIPQDNAAQTGTGNRDIAASSAAWTANPFAYSFAPYSLTLLVFPVYRHRDGANRAGGSRQSVGREYGGSGRHHPFRFPHTRHNDRCLVGGRSACAVGQHGLRDVFHSEPESGNV